MLCLKGETTQGRANYEVLHSRIKYIVRVTPLVLRQFDFLGCDINAFSAVSINPGSPQNAALCGAGCKKTFTCNNYPSVTFEATCQDGDAWSATVPSQDDRCSLSACKFV